MPDAFNAVPTNPLDRAVWALRHRIPELEAEVEQLREALDNLAEAAHEFSTLAAYTVMESVEADFVAALDDAVRLLGPGAVRDA